MAVAKEAHTTTVKEVQTEKKSVFVKLPTGHSMRRDLAVAEYGEKAVELFDHVAAKGGLIKIRRDKVRPGKTRVTYSSKAASEAVKKAKKVTKKKTAKRKKAKV